VAGAVIRPTRLTVAALIGFLDAEIREGIDAFLRAQIYASAIAAIPAVRATEGDKFLATETGTAAAAVTGLHLAFSFVDEFHKGRLPRPKRRRLRAPGDFRPAKTQTPALGRGSQDTVRTAILSAW
jgi:hypothetical protein